MQSVSIPTSWSNDEIEFQFCPCCGRCVTNEEEEGCAHLLFVYLDEVGEFIKVKPSIQKAVDQAVDFYSRLRENDDGDHFGFDVPGEVIKQYDSDSAVCFSFGANVTGAGYSVAIEFEP
jgi:hypothetical protein